MEMVTELVFGIIGGVVVMSRLMLPLVGNEVDQGTVIGVATERPAVIVVVILLWVDGKALLNWHVLWRRGGGIGVI